MGDTENRWMPPSPHREQILAEIASGAAHIVERGHNTPPLLVFEDGGMIELPRVRLQETRRGLQLTASAESATRGETRFYDACGSIDEILGQVRDGQDRDATEMAALLDDIRYMLGRMARRSEQYARFLQSVRTITEELAALERPEAESAESRLDRLARALGLREDGCAAGADTDAIVTSAEHVRALAQASEDYLGACKSAAVNMSRLYAEVKGGRRWDDAEKVDQ